MGAAGGLGAMRTRLFLLLCLLVLVTVVSSVSVAASAAKPIRLKFFSNAASRLYTDGVRMAAYEPVAGITRVVDTKTGHTVERNDPEGCGGGLSAMGGHELLYSCADPGCPTQAIFCPAPGEPEPTRYGMARYVVEHIDTGSVNEVVGTEHFPLITSRYEVQGTFSLVDVGSQWAIAEKIAFPFANLSFLNWHTGQKLNQEHEPRVAEHYVENLSRSRLLEPLCTPLQRPENHESSPPQRFLPTAYAPPFAVQIAETTDAYQRVGRYPTFMLLRCGSHRADVLPGGGDSVWVPSSIQLAGGVLTWIGQSQRNPSDEDTMYLTFLHVYGAAWHGHVYDLIGPEVGERRMLLQHTVTSLYESAQQTDPAGTPIGYRLYRASLPKSTTT